MDESKIIMPKNKLNDSNLANKIFLNYSLYKNIRFSNNLNNNIITFKEQFNKDNIKKDFKEMLNETKLKIRKLNLYDIINN
mgnify:CR=1 FL=1